MALRKIRWREEDYKNLHRAVNHFNKIVDKIKDESIGTLEKIDYKEIKSSILTRQGLKEKIARLQRLNEENAKSIITTKEGLQVTEYHFEEARLAERKYKRRLKKEFKEVSTPKPGEAGSRLQMGTLEARRIEANIAEDNIKKLYEARDTTDFNLKYERLLNKASDDIIYQKTIDYKEHYLDMIEARYSSFENYDKFYDRVKNMTPQDFYEFMKKDELTVDLTYQSDQHYGQQEFNKFLQDLGILPNETGEIEVIEAT